MKKTWIYIIMVAFVLTQCVKDEMPEIDTSQQQNSDLQLFINEVLTTGSPDWVEIYNAGDAAIDMSDFRISDNDSPKYNLPAGTNIAAKGYLVIMLDKAVTGFSLSSGGEKFYIWDTADKLIDNVEFPALADGISYGRETDGGSSWINMNPTQGVANSNVNTAPVISLSFTPDVPNDNSTTEIVATVIDANGLASVKIYYKADNLLEYKLMAPTDDNEYTCILPQLAAGTVLKYYIEATDNEGVKSYFPDTAPATKGELTIQNGFPLLSNFTISTENPSEEETVTITIDAYDVSGFDKVRLYYTIDGNSANKAKVNMTLAGGTTYTIEVPAMPENTVVQYYIKAEDVAGNESFYPNAVTDTNKDDVSNWLSYTVAPPQPLAQLVINELIAKDDVDSYYTDLGGNACDWVELYNGTDQAINIAGMWFSDKGEAAADGDKEQVSSDDSAVTTIQPGAYLVVIFGAENADGSDMVGIIDGKVFIPIGLKASKDVAVALWASDKTTLIDVSEKFNADGAFGALEDEKSLGRKSDALPKWKIFDTPTPGASNQ